MKSENSNCRYLSYNTFYIFVGFISRAEQNMESFISSREGNIPVVIGFAEYLAVTDVAQFHKLQLTNTTEQTFFMKGGFLHS